MFSLRYRLEKNPDIHHYFVPVAEVVDAKTDELLAQYAGGRDGTGTPIAKKIFSSIVSSGHFPGDKYNKIVACDLLYGGKLEGTREHPFVSGGQLAESWTAEHADEILVHIEIPDDSEYLCILGTEPTEAQPQAAPEPKPKTEPKAKKPETSTEKKGNVVEPKKKGKH